jgi:DNA-binding MarR family transcriptional regulator
MTAEDMAVLAVAATTVIGSFIGSVRWLVKHYLNELKPNSGSSLRDEISELRGRVDTILRILEK